MIYEIRRNGEVICSSSIPDCGYTPETLKDMERNGMHLYCDGKKVKSRSRIGTPESGKGK